jgi:hypothetical protein
MPMVTFARFIVITQEVSKASDPFADHFQLPRLNVGDDRQKLFLCGLNGS